MALPQTMKAVVFDGPRSVSVQDRPVPQSTPLPFTNVKIVVNMLKLEPVQDDEDIIVKVSATALCGS